MLRVALSAGSNVAPSLDRGKIVAAGITPEGGGHAMPNAFQSLGDAAHPSGSCGSFRGTIIPSDFHIFHGGRLAQPPTRRGCPLLSSHVLWTTPYLQGMGRSSPTTCSSLPLGPAGQCNGWAWHRKSRKINHGDTPSRSITTR